MIFLLNVLKCDFFEVDDAMFLEVKRPFERIFEILGMQNRDFDEFAKVVIYVGEWPCEQIIYLLDVLINDFAEVDEGMFQRDESSHEHIFCMLSIEKCVSVEFA
jgi:hypothetical protein